MSAAEGTGSVRLLPWAREDGKPCYVSGDPDGTGPVSRLADDMERVQLAMGTELLGYVRAFTDIPADLCELRFLTARLCEALTDALRIAESRGARLGHRAPDDQASP